MKLAIWANSPSPHQTDFHAALREAGVDLAVGYFGRLRAARRDMGWRDAPDLPSGERILPAGADPLALLDDWRQRVHVIPGYSRRMNWRLAARLSRAGVPWVHWSESSRPTWRSPLVWPLKRAYAALINRYALGAFAQGDMAVNDFVTWGVRRETIAHLYYAVRGVGDGAPPDSQVAQFTAGRPAFAFVGSLCRRKAVDVLIAAFAQLPAQSDARLVIVGDGPLRRQCVDQARRVRVDDRILFRGVVPMERIGGVLRCCQALVLPSRFDGWGVALNEAASAGLALVATDRVGAAHHLIEPRCNGFRVRAGSNPALATALASYVANPSLADQHGRRSRQLFAEFTPRRNVERLATAVRDWLTQREQWSPWRDAWSTGESTLTSTAA